jgi:hypothetical protein
MHEDMEQFWSAEKHEVKPIEAANTQLLAQRSLNVTCSVADITPAPAPAPAFQRAPPRKARIGGHGGGTKMALDTEVALVKTKGRSTSREACTISLWAWFGRRKVINHLGRFQAAMYPNMAEKWINPAHTHVLLG